MKGTAEEPLLLYVGQRLKLHAAYAIAEGWASGIVPTWTSDNQAVATVTTPGINVTVTAVAPGDAVLTATLNGQSDTYHVRVKAVAQAVVTSFKVYDDGLA